MKKTFKFLAAILSILLLVSACAPAPAQPETSGGEAAPAHEPNQEPASEQITITFEQFGATGENEQYILQMIDAYTAKNPHVTIKHQSFGYEDYFTQLMTKVSGGHAPDVFEMNYENFISYAKRGALLPIGDILADLNVDTSAYNDMAFRAFGADGAQYGVPNSFSNVVLFYNKALFDQAGIAYPEDDWTWEDAMTAAQKIRALDANTFGYYHPLSFHEFYKVVQQNGGSLISSDGNSFTINTPQNLETLRYMLDMQNKLNVMPTPAQHERVPNADWDLFKAGRLGMCITGIWAFPEFMRSCDFEWDIAVEPGKTSKATHFFSNCYVVSKDSAVAEEAVKFMNFIASDTIATGIRLDSGMDLPPVKDESIVNKYLALPTPANRIAVFKSLDYLVMPPVVTQNAELQDIVTRYLNDAAAETMTPEDTLEIMQAECESKIDLSK